MSTHPDTARFFAEAAERYRAQGNPRLAEIMEESLSINLLQDYAREVLEPEFERQLEEHHRRIRDGEV